MPMACLFFASVCEFLIPAWPSHRCHNQPSEAFASRHVAGAGPAEKSTIYKSPFLKPSKTLDLSDSISTMQRYLPKLTTISRSQSIEIGMRLNPKDSTSMLCPCVNPLRLQSYIDPIPCFCLCQRRWYASDEMEIKQCPSISSCHRSCDLYIHCRGPTQ